MFLLVLFACKNPSLLYKASKRRKPLKSENLETIFLLSALKKPIKSVTSYQAEIRWGGGQVSKILRGGQGLRVSEFWGGSLGKKG